MGEQIEDLQRGTRGLAPFNLEQMAILVRASHQMRAFEDRFLTIGMPYRVIGGPRFYERMEIRDAMAYFRLADQPRRRPGVRARGQHPQARAWATRRSKPSSATPATRMCRWCKAPRWR